MKTQCKGPYCQVLIHAGGCTTCKTQIDFGLLTSFAATMHRVPALADLLDPTSSFPSGAFAMDPAVLAALRQLGLRSSLQSSTLLSAARFVQALSTTNADAAAAKCAHDTIFHIINANVPVLQAHDHQLCYCNECNSFICWNRATRLLENLEVEASHFLPQQRSPASSLLSLGSSSRKAQVCRISISESVSSP